MKWTAFQYFPWYLLKPRLCFLFFLATSCITFETPFFHKAWQLILTACNMCQIMWWITGTFPHKANEASHPFAPLLRCIHPLLSHIHYITFDTTQKYPPGLLLHGMGDKLIIIRIFPIKQTHLNLLFSTVLLCSSYLHSPSVISLLLSASKMWSGIKCG